MPVKIKQSPKLQKHLQDHFNLYELNQEKLDKRLSAVDEIYSSSPKLNQVIIHSKNLHLALMDCIQKSKEGYTFVEYGSNALPGIIEIKYHKPKELQKAEIEKMKSKVTNDYHAELEVIKNELIEDLTSGLLIQYEAKMQDQVEEAKIALQVEIKSMLLS
ncbi:MAG: hypothetical protein WBM99_07845 [Psychromonas sp.]